MAGEIVVVGTSLGGLSALESILASLPSGFPAPVVIVQHRMSDARSRMISLLQLHTDLKVREPVDKEPIQRGICYIAPADYHLMLEDGAFTLSTDAPVLSARPSIDVLFESAGDSVGEGVIGVVLTGASADGAAGAAHIKGRGGRMIVQDPETAECAVMPRAALNAARPDWVVPLSEVGPLLARIVLGGPDEDDANSP